MKKYKTVIFDLDGTLLNTLEDLTDAVNAALTAYGYPARTIEEVRRFVGNGIGTLIRRAAPENITQEAYDR
ncbi:MAG: HAD hydrolase-like protein, partial [Lachnospiraceae bacterium]|nr:HAD hydrolase-like protein [Lachnospiraceae bacterium]